jgi:hypothetical protein
MQGKRHIIRLLLSVREEETDRKKRENRHKNYISIDIRFTRIAQHNDAMAGLPRIDSRHG